MVMILSLLLYLYEAALKKYKYFRRFFISALTFYFTKKADKMQVLFKKFLLAKAPSVFVFKPV